MESSAKGAIEISQKKGSKREGIGEVSSTGVALHSLFVVGANHGALSAQL